MKAKQFEIDIFAKPISAVNAQCYDVIGTLNLQFWAVKCYTLDSDFSFKMIHSVFSTTLPHQIISSDTSVSYHLYVCVYVLYVCSVRVCNVHVCNLHCVHCVCDHKINMYIVAESVKAVYVYNLLVCVCVVVC